VVLHLSFQVAELLSSILRLNDPELLQDACLLIWNTGLVLLQKNLRMQVQQPFNQAANALEKISSPLHRLRVLFHLELAGTFTHTSRALSLTASSLLP
jgi:hypothetical protein